MPTSDPSSAEPTVFGPAKHPNAPLVHPVAEFPSVAVNQESGTASEEVGAPREEAATISAGTPRRIETPVKVSNRSSDSIPDGLGRYQRIQEVARGGCGIVDRVVDRALQREVAVKRLIGDQGISDRLRHQFMHEARVTSQLQHPGIVPVHELGVADHEGEQAEAYYVMKLLEGDTLHQQIQSRHNEARARCRYKPISQHQLTEAITPLLERFIDTCEAVAYAHEQGIIHRDLKPANIMVGEFGETIVLDWGLASKIQSDEQSKASQRWVSGTPAYMSPEQARGESDRLDQRSDIYSLGMILYEIVAGKSPYTGLGTDEVLAQVKQAGEKPLQLSKRNVAPALNSMIQTATSSDRDKRYDSASELADDVRRFIAGAAVSVHRDSMIDRIVRWCKRNRTIATTIAVSTLVLLIASCLFGVVIHRAHRAELAARIDAESSHRSAVENMIDARDAADQWLVGLSGSLDFFPGMEPVRHELLEKAIKQYQRLIDQPVWSPRAMEKGVEHPAESVVWLERAKCHLRLGDLFRLTNDPITAIAYYDQANTILSNLDETSPDVRIEQVNTWIGQLMVDDSAKAVQSTTDRYRQRLRDMLPTERSEKISNDVAKAASASVRLELAAHQRHQREQKHTASVADLATATETARWLARVRQESHHHRLSHTAQTELAKLLVSNGDVDDAVDVYQSLISDLGQQWPDEDEHPEQLQRLARAQRQLADLLARQGRKQAAIARYQDSIDGLRRAWKLLDADAFFGAELDSTEQELRQLVTGETKHDDGLEKDGHDRTN
tara:strand:- start:1088942 stop:1091293 length:2352 start_codon:yes stop_codon:yes gene_type:complete